MIVERVVADMDEIVEKVRFPEWQDTDEGERTVKQALRRTLAQVQAPARPTAGRKAYGYIRQYY